MEEHAGNPGIRYLPQPIMPDNNLRHAVLTVNPRRSPRIQQPVYSIYAGQINYSRKRRILQNLEEMADGTCRQAAKKTSKNFASRKVLRRL
jgi:hypothetical protein